MMMDRLVALFLVSLAWQQLLVQANDQHFHLSPNVDYLIPVELPRYSYSIDNHKNTQTFKVRLTDDGTCLVFIDAFNTKGSKTDMTAAREFKQVRKYAVNIVRDFCRGYSVIFKNINKSNEELDYSSDLDTNEIVIPRRNAGLVRKRRGASTTVFKALPRGRYRGQTQSQYLNFGDQVSPGKAEAESTQEGSRASVSGTNGMGQAQSQSGFSSGCDGCYDNQDGTQSQTILASGSNGRYPSAISGQGFRPSQGNTGTIGDNGQSHPAYKDHYASSTGPGKYRGPQDHPSEYNINSGPGSNWSESQPKAPISSSQIHPGDRQPQGPWDQAGQGGSNNLGPQGPPVSSWNSKTTPESSGAYPSGGRDSYEGNGKVSPSGSQNYPNQYPDVPGSTGGYPSGGRVSHGENGKNQQPVGYPNQYPGKTDPDRSYPSEGRDIYGQNGKIPPTGFGNYPDTSDSTGRYPIGGRESYDVNGKILPPGSRNYPNQYPNTPGSSGGYPNEGRGPYGGNGKTPPAGSGNYPDTSGSTGYPSGGRRPYDGDGNTQYGGDGKTTSTEFENYPDTSGSTGYPSGGRRPYGGDGKTPPTGSGTYPDASSSTGYTSGGRDSYRENGKTPTAGFGNYPDTSDVTGRYPSGGRETYGGNSKLPPSGSGNYPNQYPKTPGSTGGYPNEGRDTYGQNGKLPPTSNGNYPDALGPTGYPSGGRDSHRENGKTPLPTPEKYPDESRLIGGYPSSGREPYDTNGKLPPTGFGNYPDTSDSTGRYPIGGRESYDGNGKIPPSGSGNYPNQYLNPPRPTGGYPSGERDVYGQNGKLPPTGGGNYPTQDRYPDNYARQPSEKNYGQDPRQPPSRNYYPDDGGTYPKQFGKHPSVDQEGQQPHGPLMHPSGETHTDKNYPTNNEYYPESSSPGRQGTQNIGSRPTSHTHGTDFENYGNQPYRPTGNEYNPPQREYPPTSNIHPNRQGQFGTIPGDRESNTYYPESQDPGSSINQPHTSNQNGYSGQSRPDADRSGHHDGYSQKPPPQYNRPDPSEYDQRRPVYSDDGTQHPGRPTDHISGGSNINDRGTPIEYPGTYPENGNYRPTSPDNYAERPGFSQGPNSGPPNAQKGSYYPEYDRQPPHTDTGRQKYGSTDSQSGGRGYDINQYSDNIDDTNSQAETSIQQLHNETKASALSSGKQGGGTAQSQIIGSYTGSGSFSAQAQTIDANRGAQTQISVGGKGATSTAQGNAGYGQSQAQLQLGSENGATIAGAQSGGWNHGTNTQVEASSKGGMADAQANGPGSTSSQAQIGFQPYQETKHIKEDSKPGSPFYGGGTASAQSGNFAGQSQTQIQGKFKYGLSYNGAAQAGSGGKDNFFKNKTIIKPLGIFSAKPVVAEVNAAPQAQFEGMMESESKNIEQMHFENHDRKDSDSGTVALSPTKRIRHSKAQSEPNYSEDKDPQIMDEYDNEDGDDDGDYDLEFYPSTEVPQLTPQTINNNPRDVVIQQSAHGQRQHIILGSLDNNGAKVVQDSSQKGLLKEGMLFQPGEVIPGTQGYTIPIGFRGRVSSISDGDETFAYTDENGESQAQTITLTPGSGNVTYSKSATKSQPTVRSWGPNYRYVRGPSTHRRYMNRYNLKSNNNSNIPEQYVTVTKTAAGELDSDKNNLQNKKYAHTYYTKSSTCGYFTFSCNQVYGSNGRTEICTPKAPLNPDGTPVQC